jgi:peroxiredoxin
MKTTLTLAATTFVLLTSIAFAVAPGQQAPDFTLTDSQGQKRTLSSFKGKYVVLEWTNAGCPFVKKHYDSGNMQKLQKAYTAKNVVWLSINSSAPGKEGHVTAEEENAVLKKAGAAPTAALLDSDGKVGKLYGAKTTPHMFVISPKGEVIYAGAIDSNSSADPETISGAENYVSSALDAALAGKAIKAAQTKPYGCSVKY